MNDVLLNILYTILSIVLSVGGGIAVYVIREKTGWKYKDEIADAVKVAVGYVQQTFVDGLKKEGMFLEDEQKQALNKALNVTKVLLTEGAKAFLEKRGVDDSYLVYLIEDAVMKQKKE